jgi:succinylglutamate desuccinylase
MKVDFLNIFKTLKESTVSGISGVKVLDSGLPGLVLGITIQTHGNEPSGLAVADFLLNNFDLESKLQRGKVLFVMNNIEAAEKYMEALRVTDDEKRASAKLLSRFCDINMNRLPADFMNMNSSTSEIIRVQKLLPIWSEFSVALDIHSTSQESEGMIISSGTTPPFDLIKGFPISKVITNIDKVQMGKPAMAFYGKANDTRSIAIEAGQHENDSSFERAIECARTLLTNLGMIEGATPQNHSEFDIYTVTNSVMFPDSSYKLLKVIPSFEPIHQGQILAQGDGGDIIAQQDGHALFGPATTTVQHLDEEVLFITDPVQKVYMNQ